MKILIYSPAFYPNIGGLENVALTLCKEFIKLNNDVKVITLTKHNQPDRFNFEMIRNPTFKKHYKLYKWCDIYLQFNVSLKGIWPILLGSKIFVVSHQGIYDYPGLRSYIKNLITKKTINISCSNYVAQNIFGKSIVIPNTYLESIFINKSIFRNADIVFVGRLVSDKGCDLLLESLLLLKSEGLSPSLTIIGLGPEESMLNSIVQKYGLNKQVKFIGPMRGVELVDEINKHKIMVVPSLWHEPFGIVALEGIACGCVVIGSDGGGLKDAIGKCGLTFKNGDFAELSKKIKILLTDECYLNSFKVNFAEHLDNHKPEKVAIKYLEVFESAVKRKNE